MTDKEILTPKGYALEALRDAIEESQRGVIRPAVLTALLEIARTRMEAVQELVRPRKPKAAKVTPQTKETT